MPKKSANARSGASRNKPKSQKSIQLVRPTTSENNILDESSESEEETTLAAPASKSGVASTATVSKAELATSKKSAVESEPKEKDVVDTSAASKSSAGARLAARRQTALKQQVQRNAGLVTAEHYAYVRRDLIYILILAIIMFSAIIILHFVPAVGG